MYILIQGAVPKFKRLLQTHGPYKITSKIKKTLCKYYQYHREINYIEV